MSQVYGTLRVEAGPGDIVHDVALQARDLAKQFYWVDVSFVHNDTEVRAYADDVLAATVSRWRAAREESR